MNTTKNPIPIKNLFFMLCYAWNILSIKDEILVGLDDYDDAYNVLGRVFSYGIGKLIRSGFHRSYIQRHEELVSLRGKIDIQESLKKLSIQKKKLVCNYDEYSSDDVFNQILNYTIAALLRNSTVDRSIKDALKKQKMFFGEIGEIAPTKEIRKRLHYNRNNITYKLLISIATMLYDNTAISEEDGKETFKDFFREEQMQKVYELFLLNFYAMHLDKSKYKVSAPKFSWKKSSYVDNWDDFEEADYLMPELRTDIVIENKTKNVQLIIDAKYYVSALVKSHHSDAKKFRRDHISQVMTYMINSPYDGEKRGALLYPTVTDVLDGKQNIVPGWVFFKSINLDRDWREITSDLISFVEKAFRDTLAV